MMRHRKTVTTEKNLVPNTFLGFSISIFVPSLTIEQHGHIQLLAGSGEDSGEALLRLSLGQGRLNPGHVGPERQDEPAERLPVPQASRQVGQLAAATGGTSQHAIDPGQ
jgi:hypothetical protein